jgi:hypothetical protein
MTPRGIKQDTTPRIPASGRMQEAANNKPNEQSGNDAMNETIGRQTVSKGARPL